MRGTDQRVANLEYDARRPRLPTVADGQPNTKTLERTKGGAKAVQAKHVDSCTAQRVQDRQKISTCFGVVAEPPALLCRDDVVVDNGAAAPKSCLPSLEMPSPTAAGGLLSTGEASIATMTTNNQPPLRLYSTEELNSKETNLRTPILYVSYDSSFLPSTLSCERVIETKSGQNRMFDPGGFQGRLRACPFLETWRALPYGEVIRFVAAGGDLQCFFWLEGGPRNIILQSEIQAAAFFPQRLI